jgi:carboxyl-terminal processing protease
MQKIKLFGLIALIVSLSGLLAFRSADNYFEVSKNLEIFTAIVKDVNTYYVDEVEPASLLRTGIDAMLKSLDPYTDYYSESEIEDYRFMTTGQYGGVGASIAQSGDYIMILEPYEGWPAQKAGLRAGDLMMEIDGKSMKGKSMDDISKLLKGQPETQMKMLIKRVGVEKPFEVVVNRAEIKVKNVPYYGMINKTTGYIKFTGFRQDAASEVSAALQDLQKKNPGMSSLVFDLRGNPGGLLDEAIKTVNIFVDKGLLVVSTRGKVQEWNKEYKTENEPVDTKIPVAVLIDGGSASAAEIVSGSLQDLDRAVVIGSNSFGKGLVQTTRPLPYNTQMKITTSKYYIPSGRCIQALDYSHKDENGKALKMPDSLRRAFKTKDGRTVYDGNGIKPDVTVKKGKYSDVVVSLLEKRLIFDYANHFRSTHDSISPAADYKLTEVDWQDFLNFLKGKNYEYKTDTEEQLEQLASTSKDENYYDAIKADFEDIEKKLKMEKHEDVNKYKEDIRNILQEEIASRYFYQSGRIESSFDHDPDIKEALNILNNPKEYNKIIGHL